MRAELTNCSPILGARLRGLRGASAPSAWLNIPGVTVTGPPGEDVALLDGSQPGWACEPCTVALVCSSAPSSAASLVACTMSAPRLLSHTVTWICEQDVSAGSSDALKLSALHRLLVCARACTGSAAEGGVALRMGSKYFASALKDLT
jgi:hypothetical protein